MDFESIYRDYFDDVYRYLRGLTLDDTLAEELTQDTFFKAMRSLDRFEGRCDVRVWLCQIAKNAYRSHLRKRKHLASDEIPEDTDSGERLEHLLEDRDLALRLHRVLHDTREPYKEVFSLRVFGELGFREIGMLFGKSEHWACVTYHRAKERIRKGLEETE